MVRRPQFSGIGKALGIGSCPEAAAGNPRPVAEKEAHGQGLLTRVSQFRNRPL
jgi:hypothetical protein